MVIFENRNNNNNEEIFKAVQSKSNEVIAEQTYNTINNFEATFEDVNEIEESSTSESGSVKGVSCKTSSPTGCSSKVVRYNPVCVNGSSSVYVGNGSQLGSGESVTIRANYKLEVWKVTAPLGILSGIETTKSNAKKITKTDPFFPSGSELIDSELVAKSNMDPIYGVNEIDNIVKESNDNSFGVNTQVMGGGGGEQGDGPNIATVFKSLSSRVKDASKNQPSTPSPEKTNKLGEKLVDLYGDPIEGIKTRNFVDHEFACVYINPNDVEMPKQDIFELCLDKRSAWDNVAQVIMPLVKFLECAANPSECEKKEIVGLLIDAPFGRNGQCPSGSCSNQNADYAVATGLSPYEVSDYEAEAFRDDKEPGIEDLYVSTPCQIRVNYGRIYNVPCYWDVSPYRNYYLVEAQVTSPVDKEFPTFDEYWKLVKLAAENRGSVCNI